MTDQLNEDQTPFQEMLDGALEAFETAREVLRDTLKRLKAEEPVESTEVPKHIREMNNALILAMGLEGKARDATGQRMGEIGAGQLDLDAARAEIGLRLACLRAAGGGGTVPGGAE
ncbi:hypothetical protein [Nioella sediminis]|jgi:hypothetical protein|uniref:hypothetical protein n=1 Tax=Nioella sediminis TaxID=1912092 RepID=UPI0008FD10C8|nr:hypothetical protein [Nioella sediminis]